MKLWHRIKRRLGIVSPSDQYLAPTFDWPQPPKPDIAAGPLTGYRSISQTPCDALCGLFPHPDYRTQVVAENDRQRGCDGC